VGFASFVMTGMACVSNAVLNFLASGYGAEAVAGLGIAKQVDQLIFSCSIGLAQGTLPLIAYNFASGDHQRLRAIVRTAVAGGMSLSAAATLLLILFSAPLTAAFIDEPVTAGHASTCVRIIAIACPISILGHLMISGFQACGARWQPLLLAFLRKGTIDAPLMWVFSSLFGFYGIAAAIPVSENHLHGDRPVAFRTVPASFEKAGPQGVRKRPRGIAEVLRSSPFGDISSLRSPLPARQRGFFACFWYRIETLIS
jgi:multidrug efflux pump